MRVLFEFQADSPARFRACAPRDAVAFFAKCLAKAKSKADAGECIAVVVSFHAEGPECDHTLKVDPHGLKESEPL